MLCFLHPCCCSAFGAGQVCVNRVWLLHTTYSGGSQVSGVMDVSPGKQRRVNSRRRRHVYLPHPSPCSPPPPLNLLPPRASPSSFPPRGPSPPAGTDSLPKTTAHRHAAQYLHPDEGGRARREHKIENESAAGRLAV